MRSVGLVCHPEVLFLLYMATRTDAALVLPAFELRLPSLAKMKGELYSVVKRGRMVSIISSSGWSSES